MMRQEQRHVVVSKPPKLRFRPGQFFRLKKARRAGEEVGQLFCLVWVYRLTSEPSIWRHELEERKDCNDPSTPLSVHCEAIVGHISSDAKERIKWETVRQHPGNWDKRDYMHGSRTTAMVKDLLNDYELVTE